MSNPIYKEVICEQSGTTRVCPQCPHSQKHTVCIYNDYDKTGYYGNCMDTGDCAISVLCSDEEIIKVKCVEVKTV